MNPDLQRLLNSVRDAVKAENWLAGLALALALPDICASIQGQPIGAPRYISWWDAHFGKIYTYGSGPNDYVTGEEAWMLRCAYLHQGIDVADPIQVKRYQATIDTFNFNVSGNHLEKVGTRVLLVVRTFCLNMCSKVEEWDNNVLSKDREMLDRASKLLKIYMFVSLSGSMGMTGSVNPTIA